MFCTSFVLDSTDWAGPGAFLKSRTFPFSSRNQKERGVCCGYRFDARFGGSLEHRVSFDNRNVACHRCLKFLNVNLPLNSNSIQGCSGVRESEEARHRDENSSGKCHAFCKADDAVAKTRGRFQPVTQGTCTEFKISSRNGCKSKKRTPKSLSVSQFAFWMEKLCLFVGNR